MFSVETPLFSLTPLLGAVSPEARSLFPEVGFLSAITSSIFVALIVLGFLLWFAKKATSNMQLVPHKAQNGFEFLVEFLYGRVESIVGPKVAPQAFPLLATLFIFILVSNLSGLFPGVGTIGWGTKTQGFMTIDGHDMTNPLLRPPTADVNLTLAMAVAAMVVWLYLTIREAGVIGFLKHTFLPKGGMKGLMWVMMLPIFLFVGIIEIISILFRPVTLPLRLYGNIYAGENVLHSMMSLADKAGQPWSFLGSVAFALPFYFMELLVGLLQAVVFTLLCTVYIQLSTAHDESHDEAHH